MPPPPCEREKLTTDAERYIAWFEQTTNADVARVRGKNASLGEMIRNLKDEGVRVPAGYATTADGYRDFVASNAIEERMRAHPRALREG